ncbi:MAG: cobalamin biosynthesis protein CbiX [Candidatus Dactylopiibacterium carminicum]|uniref:Cobalamin biosynthesis protein CbiX n=1 Tax=Candidatus Dactylopiibacterium carminicum TaxID=857335 RepID=A0A272EP53_9RHOO|nr:CbiX/SirB N-terminal domain-containing protein [Candidatus Dactylopiibacterium carminicum]KAF7599198.1 cobalamin biosynthesis protein CbiX [Candidatus Dactylopiibacterium carminicum]PAS91816.1 MAG: cobalamin biosynthesis protein CbiX [Candidatus Dactylopiibacterium carminicum]PAS94387.1 MAG: cobalamin biosynthesis protein CbiX [Candidatus Dactylopiibacterium carminicum]PAS99213.1 MAG: cobalamin biosynthesis protein CbiX [Candidatus Dactylopiibacterium carminicum]
MDALILLAHGARDPDWAAPLRRLQEVVGRQTDAEVHLAFLEFMLPTLPVAIDTAVERGASRISVLPVFLAQSGHVKRDLPEILAQAQSRHPQVSLDLYPALGEAPEVIAALAAAALRAHDGA